MNELVLASGNKGKLREFNALFGHRSIKVLSQAELGVKAAEEPFNTFVENALAKARNAARQTGLPAMADDSGITAEALNGAPGVHSARYAGDAADDTANNRKLVAALAGKTDRRAHYTCVLVAVKSADDPEPAPEPEAPSSSDGGSDGSWWGGLWGSGASSSSSTEGGESASSSGGATLGDWWQSWLS